MKQAIEYKVAMPEGVSASIENAMLTVKGKQGEISRDFAHPLISVTLDGSDILVACEKATKREKCQIGTFNAHIKNMVNGVQKKFTYTLKICSSHFPMNVAVSGQTLTVKNFLGEKNARVADVPVGVSAKVQDKDIILESVDRELAGIAASRIEQLTRVTNKDRRIFQDGIYITGKDQRRAQ